MLGRGWENVPRGEVTRSEDLRREGAGGLHGLKFIWFGHRIERACLETGEISQDWTRILWLWSKEQAELGSDSRARLGAVILARRLSLIQTLRLSSRGRWKLF